MSVVDGPVLKWPGSKWRIADRIAASLPPHTTYLEPFFGSGAVFFRKSPGALETINDRDDRVVNLFRVLRERPDDLARAIALTPWSRTEYASVYTLPPFGDPVEAARRFLVRCWQSHGSRLDRRSGWRHATGRGDAVPRDYPADWAGLPARIAATAARLRAAQIECRPALEVLARHAHPNCLVYADPPYPLATRGDLFYAMEMDNDDHRALLAALVAHPGPVVVSGYACALYDEALAGWHRETLAATAEGGRARTEVIWRNARAARPQLWASGWPDTASVPPTRAEVPQDAREGREGYREGGDDGHDA